MKKRFIAILLLCLVVSTPMVAATPRPQRVRIEISSTRIVIATAIRLLQWRFGILPTSTGLTPPVPGPTSTGLTPPVPRPTTCCK